MSKSIVRRWQNKLSAGKRLTIPPRDSWWHSRANTLTNLTGWADQPCRLEPVPRAAQRLESEADLFRCRVVRRRCDGEAKIGGELQHLRIHREHETNHCLEPASAGNCDQLQHQIPSKALALPCFGHHDRVLARSRVRVDDIARNADLALSPFLLYDGDQCHFPVVIHLGEAREHSGREILHRTQKAQVLRLRRQRLDKLSFYLRVLRTDRAHNNTRSVFGSPRRSQMRGIRMYSHMGVCKRARG